MINKIGLGLSIAFASFSVQAELLAPLPGRTANPADRAPVSVEAGVTILDDTFFGGRFNYQLNESLELYGDLGFIDYDGFVRSEDATTFGGGIFYYLGDLVPIPEVESAVRASYHQANFDVSGSFDLELSELSAELLVSSIEPIMPNGLKWYAHAGLNSVRASVTAFGISASDSDIEIGFGGGVVLPLANGEVYGGARYIEDLDIGAGYRFFF